MKKFTAALFVLFLSGLPAFAQAPQMRGTVNASVVITTGNTFQTVIAAATAAARRNSLTIQNNNASDSCWIVVGGALGSTTKGISILLASGAAYTRYFPYIPSDAIHATCATSSDTLYIDTQ